MNHRLLVGWSKESEARFTTEEAALEDFKAPYERAKRLKQSVPFLRQVQVLTSRTLLATIRDPFGLVGSWSQAIFMGLVCGLIFYRIPHSLAGIRSTQAALYLLGAGHSYLFILFEIYRLTRVDIQLFDRERGENLVTGVAWVVSRRIAHGILEDFTVPFLFCFIFAHCFLRRVADQELRSLDEPTSGLDAFTACSIIEVLEGLAQEGRTVIATIHQGRSDLFPHFGNILLLAKGGEVAYSGRGSNMLPYFASLGHSCPLTTNPADLALDIVSVDLREEKNEGISREKVENLIRQFAATQQSEKLAVESEARAEQLGLAG